MSLLRFALVGGFGFSVDVLTFLICSQLMPVLPARGVAFWVAASSNWLCNRRFTFAASDKGKAREWSQFMCASLVGFIPNWGLYAYLQHSTAWAQQSPLLALLPGILLGMLCNYTLARCWVFARAR